MSGLRGREEPKINSRFFLSLTTDRSGNISKAEKTRSRVSFIDSEMPIWHSCGNTRWQLDI